MREVFMEGLRLSNWNRTGACTDARYIIRWSEQLPDTRMSIKVSSSYRYAVVCSPMGAYFPRPVRVEDETVIGSGSAGETGFANAWRQLWRVLIPRCANSVTERTDLCNQKHRRIGIDIVFSSRQATEERRR